MAGGGFFVAGAGGDEEGYSSHGGHAVQWVGTAGVKGPKWGKLPLLTIGMLGIQCVWSIEMGYGTSRLVYPHRHIHPLQSSPTRMGTLM